MTAKQIIFDYLEEAGRNCLFNEQGCCCGMDNLMFCRNDDNYNKCEMGYLLNISALCRKCEAYGATEDYCPYLYNNNDSDRWIISKSKRHPCRGFKES